MAKKELEIVAEQNKGWKPDPIVYSISELQEFDKWLEPYYTKSATLPNGEIVKGWDWKKVYFDLGAINKDGAVIINELEYRNVKHHNGDIQKHPYSCKVPQEELENKIDQWKFWKGRDEWVEKKKIGELQKMADEIGAW